MEKKYGGFTVAELTDPARVQSLLTELDWCIANGNTGPRSSQAIECARAVIAALAARAEATQAVRDGWVALPRDLTPEMHDALVGADAWPQKRWDALLAAAPQPPVAEAARGTDAQILFERKLTCEAIDGAMAFGYQNANPPPSDDYWLAPYWMIGRRLAVLEQEDSDAEAMTAVWPWNRRDPQAPVENAARGDRTVDELAMLVKQLVHSLRRAAPDNALADRAVDYLTRRGLQGSPLRVETQPGSSQFDGAAAYEAYLDEAPQPARASEAGNVNESTSEFAARHLAGMNWSAPAQQAAPLTDDARAIAFKEWEQGWWFCDGGVSVDETCSYSDAESVAEQAFAAGISFACAALQSHSEGEVK